MGRLALAAAIGLLPGLLASPAQADGGPGGPRLDPGKIGWERIELEASKLFVSAATTVTLAVAPAVETRAALEGGVVGLPVGDEGAVVVEIDGSFGGRHSVDRVWLRPADAAAFGRKKLRLGRSPYRKVFWFASDAVLLHRSSPADAREGRGEPERWSKLEEHRYELPRERPGCAAVTHPSALLYLLAALPVSRDEPVELCVFTDERLVLVEMKALGLEEVPVDVALETPDGPRRRRGRRAVQRLTLLPRDLDGNASRDFELLGLEGEVQILLDPEDRLPLRIEGRLGSWGEVAVRLVSATLRRH